MKTKKVALKKLRTPPGKAKSPRLNDLQNVSGSHVVAVRPDGTTLVYEIVGSAQSGLVDNSNRAIVVTDDNGKVTASGDGVAIGGWNSKATASTGGLAQVLSGDAVCNGPRSVAIVRQAGSASANGDGGIAAAMRGGNAYVQGLGVAIAFDGGSVSGLAGCVLAVLYWDEKGKKYQFAVGIVGQNGLKENTRYVANGYGGLKLA